MLKDIRIFVASSKELLPERNALAYFVLAHEDEFARRGFRVRLSKWEYVDPTMTEERTEDRYLDEMLNCDAVLMLFRHVLGKYTKEEVDKAIAAETAGTSRIKKHLILFKEGDADESPELAAWRASLSDGTYGTFSDAKGLGAHFLRLVEQVSGLPLQDVAREDGEKVISAFLAVDDELASDRDAFADAVVNLNDVLSRRGARVRLRFYDPDQHRDLLDNSEMALVLYQTKCGAFGAPALKESYELAKAEKNPKRLYVFFRDGEGKLLDADFQAFRDGFAESFGSAPCRFENVDTLSLNFLFALENVLGDGSGTFVKLDGQMVVADGLEVGDLTKLPMLKKNAGLANLFSRMEDVSKRFVAQREKCDKHPQNDGLYVELLDLSAEKNRLQDQIDRELKMSFNLAKRLAAISIAQVNETIARARAKMECGCIKEALEILDGASSALKRRRLLCKSAERAAAEEVQIKEQRSAFELESLRVDAVMAYAEMPFEDRFKKAEAICRSAAEDLGAFAEMCALRNRNEIDLLYAEALLLYAGLYSRVGDSLSPNPILTKLADVYQQVQERGGPDCALKRLSILSRLAYNHEVNNLSDRAEKEYLEILSSARAYADANDGRGRYRVAKTLLNLGRFHYRANRFPAAESEFKESLEILAKLDERCPGKYEADIVEGMNGLSGVYKKMEAPDKARPYFENEIQIMSRRVQTHLKERYLLAGYLLNYGIFLHRQGENDSAKKALLESHALWSLVVKDNPLKYDGNYADVLGQLGVVCYALDEVKQAEEYLNESASVYRRNVARNPKRFLPGLATCLHNLAVLYEGIDQKEKADLAYGEALDSFRKMAELSPLRYEGALAHALSSYGDFVEAKMKDSPRAEMLYKEALAIRRGQFERSSGKMTFKLESSLIDLAYLCNRQKRYDEAERYYIEAMNLLKRLADQNPERYSSGLRNVVAALKKIYEKTGRPEQAAKMDEMMESLQKEKHDEQ